MQAVKSTTGVGEGYGYAASREGSGYALTPADNGGGSGCIGGGSGD